MLEDRVEWDMMGHDFLSVVRLLHCLHSLQVMAGLVPDILAVWNRL